jgi:hypothetical protein
MIPRVYPNQRLHNGNGGFVINGPTGDWEADELAAVITFVVTQGQNGTTAIGIGESPVYDRPPAGASFDWRAPVQHVSGPAFHSGAADVQAWASIAESEGASEMYPWNVPITISL